MPKLMVTGGAGYVGCVLVPKLIRHGFDVRVLDLLIFGVSGLNAVKERCEIIEGDMRDTNCLQECLKGVDSVIHLAAISNDSSGNLDPELTRQINFEATKDLAILAKEHGVQRFIYASSSSVYGIKTVPDVTEDLPLEPLTIYSKTKAWSEAFLIKEAAPDFSPVSVRSATVCGYSPRQRLDTVVNLFAIDAITEGRIQVNGGEQERPIIHVDDITDLYIRLLEVPRETITGEICNAGAGNYTLMEIAKITREMIGDHVEIIKRPRSPDSRSYRISSEKIGERLGFYPRNTIAEAIQDIRVAFEEGRLPNPSGSIYRNIARMQEIGIEKFL